MAEIREKIVRLQLQMMIFNKEVLLPTKNIVHLADITKNENGGSVASVYFFAFRYEKWNQINN